MFLPILGVVIFLLGLYFFSHSYWKIRWQRSMHPLINTEIELFEQHGATFPGEPDWMGTFRKAESEGDLLDNKRSIKFWSKARVVGSVAMIVGAAIVIINAVI
jgi:hypothetical protein